VTVLPPEVTMRVVVTVGVGAMSPVVAPVVVPVAPAHPRVAVVTRARRGNRMGEKGIMKETMPTACWNLRADPH
jgi:hypothetical protein